MRPRTRPDVLSFRRIGALILRYWYLLLGSWPRFIEIAYWPTVQMILWGFISQFFYTHSSWVAQAFGVLLAAVLLWDTLFRAELGFSVSFLEEMWSRNLGQLFVTPLRPYEFVLSLMGMSVIRTVIGVLPAMALAIPLYHFSIFELGFAGWSLGTPFLLGSWWALIPAVATILALMVRTSLEDLTLQEELPGYRAYTTRTRYRLVPGVW